MTGRELTIWEFAVFVETIMFVVSLFLLVALLTALVYIFSPAKQGQDPLEKRIEYSVFAVGAAVGLIVLQIF